MSALKLEATAPNREEMAHGLKVAADRLRYSDAEGGGFTIYETQLPAEFKWRLVTGEAPRALDTDEIVSGFEDWHADLESEGDAAVLADDSRGIAQLVARWASEQGLRIVAPEVAS
jgi:hypothetical protein